ncbi:MAG: hypothetical protein ABII22_03230 [Candidatus Micrarchaeota archaeon]
MGVNFLTNFDPSAGANWVVLVVLAVVISIIIHAVLLAFAKGFHQEELERYAMSEILQVLATLFILLFVMFIIDMTLDNFIVQTYFGSSNPDQPMESKVNCAGQEIDIKDVGSALDVVKCRLMENAQSMAKLHNDAYLNSKSGWALISTRISSAGIPVFQGDWISSWYKEVEKYRYINQVTTQIMIASNAMIDFVNYIKNNALALFLPFGILLRSFQFSRGIGAFFIAAALGFYFIFPVIFTLTDPGLVKVTLPSSPININTANSCFPTFSGVATALSEAGPKSKESENALSLAASSTSKYYTDAILRLFVDFAITLIFVRYMMYLLGGEQYTLMRMVSRVV